MNFSVKTLLHYVIYDKKTGFKDRFWFDFPYISIINLKTKFARILKRLGNLKILMVEHGLGPTGGGWAERHI